MFGFIKKVFFTVMYFFFRCNPINVINKCSGTCNNINDSYAKLCIPNIIKNKNIRVFNLMSRSNQTGHIE